MKLPWTKKNTTPPPARRQPEPLNPAALRARRDKLQLDLDMVMWALPETAGSVVYVSRQLAEVQEQLRKAEKGRS